MKGLNAHKLNNQVFAFRFVNLLKLLISYASHMYVGVLQKRRHKIPIIVTEFRLNVTHNVPPYIFLVKLFYLLTQHCVYDVTVYQCFS
jgi:hypothetical protein